MHLEYQRLNVTDEKRVPIFIILSFLILSCEGVKQKTKETLNKGGETVGETATEFLEGVSEGIDKTLQCEIVLSQALQDNGLHTGKFSIENSTTGGENNVLVLYIIFNNDFKATLTAKAFDKKGLEIGRSKVAVEGKASDAGYYDFAFDTQTYLEVKSKINLEQPALKFFSVHLLHGIINCARG